MSPLTQIAVDRFNRLQDACVALAARGMTAQLNRKEAQRGKGAFRWLTADEAATLEALATIIVPADEDTPGLEDVGVFGPPAIVALDTLIATSPQRRPQYSRGLLSFDVWSLKKHGRTFAEMPKEDQWKLFAAAYDLHESWMATESGLQRLRRKLRRILQATDGSLFAAQLVPQIRDDCFQVFYTNRVSWVWLGYDGPPMDEGYPNLAERSS